MDEIKQAAWFYFLVVFLVALALFGCLFFTYTQLLRPFLKLGTPMPTPTPWF